MPKTNTQTEDQNAQDFQIPPQDQNLTKTDPNFVNPVPPADMSVNQIANQGQDPQQGNEIKNDKVNGETRQGESQSERESPGGKGGLGQETGDRSNQASVYGKSELLDANQILSKLVGIKTGHRVADLGAGGGLFTLQAARLVGDQGEVYAVDLIKAILSDIESKARMANLYNIKTVWSNLEILGATKIPEATLDFVLLVNVLFQSKESAKIINEGARLLKSGGKMLIIDWNKNNNGIGPHDDRQIKPAEVTDQAQKINLVLEQEFNAGQYHFGLIFVKQ
jgi:SAM-dependent methyltransferase